MPDQLEETGVSRLEDVLRRRGDVPQTVATFEKILELIGGTDTLATALVESLNRTKPGTAHHKAMMDRLFNLMGRYDEATALEEEGSLASLSDEELEALTEQVMQDLGGKT